MMKEQCCKCMALYTPVLGSSMIHCPMCEVAQRNAAADAERHRKAILAGSPTETPENDREHREVRRAIKRRLSTEPDTHMPNWRDK